MKGMDRADEGIWGQWFCKFLISWKSSKKILQNRKKVTKKKSK
jgi:hypothetical protein